MHLATPNIKNRIKWPPHSIEDSMSGKTYHLFFDFVVIIIKKITAGISNGQMSKISSNQLQPLQ